MSRKAGSARYTDHITVAVEPDQKSRLEAEAARRGVNPSVAARWAFDEWIERSKATRPDTDRTSV